jgi:DNA polymerase elongation subunit (family B)
LFKNIYYDSYKNKIHLWEIVDGKHKYETFDHEIEYYVEDKTRKSQITDIYGTPVVKKIAESTKSLRELRKMTKLYESDVSEEVKFLQKRYGDSEERVDPTQYNVCVIDIEVASGCKFSKSHEIKIRKDNKTELVFLADFELCQTQDYEVWDEEIKKWTSFQKSCYFETSEFPKPELAKYPINLITLNFVNKGKIYTFGSDPYTGNSPLVKNYYHDKNEKQLLEKFVQFWRKSKVDIAVAYNAPFDFGYILKRCENLGIDPNLLSPVGRVEYKNPKRIRIHGITILDYIDLYKKFSFTPQPSYKLENVAMAEIKEGKTKYEGNIFTIWQTDWNLFVEYNIQDTILVEKMDKKRKFVNLAIKLAVESIVPIDRCMTTTAIVEGYILKTIHKQNKIMSDRVKEDAWEKDDDDDDELEGAYVEAHPGFYNWSMSFDVESLYPHMIMMYNISPETKLSFEDIKNMDPSEYIKTPVEGVYYKKNVEGIIPKIVETIFKERKYYKGLKDNAEKQKNWDEYDYFDGMQHNRKILINSIFGVFGAEVFHYFDIDNASVITAGGRELIKFLSLNANDYLKNFLPSRIGKFYNDSVVDSKKVPKISVKIIDTDSCYVSIEQYYKQINHGMSFIDFANDFDHRILTPFFNKLVDIYCEKYNIPNKINFKREKIITKMFVQVKKKYVCQIIANEGEVYDKPKIKITGLETKKSDLPGFCKKGLNELIDIMFDGELPDEERMLEVVRKYQKIHKNSPIEEIAIPKGVKDYKKYAIDFSKGMNFLPSTPIHNRASINHNYMVQKYKLPYREIDDGAKIKYLFVNQTNELHQNVIAFDDEWPELFDKKFTVDRDTLFIKTFLDISQRMFDALGFRKISLKENKMSMFLKKQ